MSMMRILTTAAFTAGAVLALPAAHAATLRTLYSFAGGTDGAYPSGPLVYRNGFLYGTTSQGAGGGCQPGCGIIYKIDAASGAETVLYRFTTSMGSPVLGVTVDGIKLFGATGGGYSPRDRGTVYEFNTATGRMRVLYKFHVFGDGRSPAGRPVYVNGTLFGDTSYGGTKGRGMVYGINISTKAETVLHNFTEHADGGLPAGELTFENGSLYGTTTSGGHDLGGVAFAVNAATGTETVLHAFGRAPDGSSPEGPLTYNAGTFYGTSFNGGADNLGTVFSYDTATNTESVPYGFSGPRGSNPASGVIFRGGALYGVTMHGGAHGDGVVFKVDPARGSEKVLYSFSGSDGMQPYGGLAYVSGSLYGTTTQGGASNGGTVFMLTP